MFIVFERNQVTEQAHRQKRSLFSVTLKVGHRISDPLQSAWMSVMLHNNKSNLHVVFSTYKMSQHVVPKTNDGSTDGEIVRPAFAEVPDGPRLSYNLPFDKACLKHVKETFAAERVYILASGSLCRNTEYVQQLRTALGHRVAGSREGMTPHTLWSEVLEVAEDCRRLQADLIVTIGGGSLTDAAKIVALVSYVSRTSSHRTYKCRQLITHME